MGELEKNFIKYADMRIDLRKLNNANTFSVEDYYRTLKISEEDEEKAICNIQFKYDIDKPIEPKMVSYTSFSGSDYKVGIITSFVLGGIWVLAGLGCDSIEVVVLGLIAAIPGLVLIIKHFNEETKYVKEQNKDYNECYKIYKKQLERYNVDIKRFNEEKGKIKNEFANKRSAARETIPKILEISKKEISKISNDEEYIELNKEFNGDSLSDEEVVELKLILENHRAETLKDAYDILEQRQHDRFMEKVAYEEYEEQRIANMRANDERRRAEEEARRQRREAERAAEREAEEHKRKVKEYANACRVYDTRKNAPKVYGSVSIESAKYKRDKAYADLFGK